MSSPKKNTGSNSFNEIATLRIELQDTDPVIWRQVEVPTSITLKVLHDIIQAVMGWFNYHSGSSRSASRDMGCRRRRIGEPNRVSKPAKFACATC
jgi:Plasmid pRiA4b ORF-3-like protein